MRPIDQHNKPCSLGKEVRDKYGCPSGLKPNSKWVSTRNIRLNITSRTMVTVV